LPMDIYPALLTKLRVDNARTGAAVAARAGARRRAGEWDVTGRALGRGGGAAARTATQYRPGGSKGLYAAGIGSRWRRSCVHGHS
jgi:hypothetical protein